MTDIINHGLLIELAGKSGTHYAGSIYTKGAQTNLTGGAVVCLTNSFFSNHAWQHEMNSIFSTQDAQEAFDAFANRGDISHMVMIPQDNYGVKKLDTVDDLVRNYIHK